MNLLKTKQPPNFSHILATSSVAAKLRRHRPNCFSAAGKRRILKITAMRAVVQRVASASVGVSNAISHTRAQKNFLPAFLVSFLSFLQRKFSCHEQVEGRIVSAIGPGLLVLVGLHESDEDSDAEYICRKVLNMRLFPNEKTGKTWDQNVMQKNLEVLLVSQFTLYGILKGNKPDFHVAMPPEKARSFYESVVENFRKAYRPDVIKDGIFGAMMKVNLVNDGPVTMQLDSVQPSRNTNDTVEAS